MNKNILLVMLITAIALNSCSDNPAVKDKNRSEDSLVKRDEPNETRGFTASPGPGKTDNCGGPAANEKLKQNSTLAALTGMTEEEAKEWKPGGESGVTDFAIDTLFNDHCILCIRAEIEYMGAYPSHANEYHVFSLHTGEAIPVSEVLSKDKIAELVGICNKRLQLSIEKERAERIADKKDMSDFEDAVKSYPSVFTQEDLKEFYVTPEEIVFIHEFGFPHVIQELEPDGEIKFSRRDIKTYLKPGCLLDF